MALLYKEGTTATVGANVRVDHLLKNALVEAAEEQFLFPLASKESIPLHTGKTIKRERIEPLISDKNISAEGIDSTGKTVAGNLWGSSRDVGSITGLLPEIGEEGGRFNRVGFTKNTISATIKDYGFFFEYTEDSMQFDDIVDLYQKLCSEAVKGANKIQETLLNIDLISVADATVVFAGNGATDGTRKSLGKDNIITYNDLRKLDRKLTLARCPYQTKIITGSAKQDTRVVGQGRIAYVGPELETELENLKDQFGNPAFVSVEHYADAGHILNGEVGKVGKFRIIMDPYFLHFAGEGAAAGEDTTIKATGGKCDVFPFLVIGDDSFSTVGLASSKAGKFVINEVKPGSSQSVNFNDPFGKKGLFSIQFWYGFMAQRPERIGLIYSCAHA